MRYRQKRDLYWDAIDGIQAANKALEALAIDYKDEVASTLWDDTLALWDAVLKQSIEHNARRRSGDGDT